MHFSRSSFVIFWVMFSTVVSAEVPRLINYQGYLKASSGALPSGPHLVTFSLDSSEVSQGSPIWLEPQNVIISSGVFNVLLGNVVPFPENLFKNYSSLYLTITVDNHLEFSNTHQLTAVPYSIGSEHALFADSSAKAAKVSNIDNAQIGTHHLQDSSITSDKIAPGALSFFRQIGGDQSFTLSNVSEPTLIIDPNAPDSSTVSIDAEGGALFISYFVTAFSEHPKDPQNFNFRLLVNGKELSGSKTSATGFEGWPQSVSASLIIPSTSEPYDIGLLYNTSLGDIRVTAWGLVALELRN